MGAKDYNSKPAVLQAMQFLGTVESAKEIMKWMRCSPVVRGNEMVGPQLRELIIDGLDGLETLTRGQFVIELVKGRFHAIPRSVFALMFESVEPQEPPVQPPYPKTPDELNALPVFQGLFPHINPWGVGGVSGDDIIMFMGSDGVGYDVVWDGFGYAKKRT